jgi:capsular polysaccharide biosynthesis protein
MSQQPMNLRRATRIVRRHKRVAGGLVILGLLGGVGFSFLYPVNVSSSVLVVLPQSQPSASSTSNGLDVGLQTDILIAKSQTVLSAAVTQLDPGMSLQELSSDVSVTQVASSALSIAAAAGTAAQAEKEANAVANSFVSYIGSANSPIGPVQARVLTPATPATGKDIARNSILVGLIGAIAGLLVGFVVALRINWGDPRLHDRDEIANSIGVPVIAALPAKAPMDAGGWLSLFEAYQPDAVHAWRLRATLDRMGVMSGGADAQGGYSLTVLSLSSDPNALALGPQIAAFAASLGIPTVFAINAPHEAKSSAALRTACATSRTPVRNGKLLFTADSGIGDANGASRARLTVVAVVVDRDSEQLPSMARTTAAVLGVSAGAASGEQLALATAVAADTGTVIAGIIVANPDSDDKTTGSVPRPVRSARRELPTKHANAREVRTGD